MATVIRSAHPDDADPIAAIIEQAFDDVVAPDYINTALQEDGRITYVAEVNKVVVAFVDGFLTLAKNGTRRAELDLLAVHPDYRGQGLGQQLIAQFKQSNSTSGYDAALLRALVAADNTAMHKAMQATGYTLIAPICQLLVSSSDDEIAHRVPPDNAYIVPVTTLTYTGLWLEGVISSAAIQAALAARNTHQLDIVGAVVSISDKIGLKALSEANFRHIGNYQWWHYALK